MIGDDDPEAVLEVWRTKDCNSYSGGIAGFFKKVISGKWKDINFDYCPCIPLDLGEAASLQGVLNALWSFVKSIPSGFWSGKFDIGIRTKSPQLEKTQKELWQKMWIEDGGSRELNVEAEAMLKNITISYSQALLNAYNASFEELKKIGYKNMKATYHSENDGICTINFAFEENGVRCYPDLIKVSVSLSDGKIISVDARNYLLSHRSRNLKNENFSVFAEAEKKVSPLLHVKDSRLAVIPTPSEDEKLCAEFHCSDDNGQEVLVYINAETLNEEEILLLMYSDNGVLTK